MRDWWRWREDASKIFYAIKTDDLTRPTRRARWWRVGAPAVLLLKKYMQKPSRAHFVPIRAALDAFAKQICNAPQREPRTLSSIIVLCCSLSAGRVLAERLINYLLNLKFKFGSTLMRARPYSQNAVLLLCNPFFLFHYRTKKKHSNI